MPLDPKALEAAARGIYEKRHAGLQNVYEWDDSGLDDEHPGHRERYMRDAEAAVTAYLAAISETHVVVPRVATEKMMFAANLRVNRDLCEGTDNQFRNAFRELYTAMIKAAKQPNGQ